MFIILRTTRLGTPGGDPVVKTMFHVDALQDEERAATLARVSALCARLNLASAMAYMTTKFPPERHGPYHDAVVAGCLVELAELDSSAPADAWYTVDETAAFAGPVESGAPHAAALMASYASSAHPPANVIEAVLRVLRDVGI